MKNWVRVFHKDYNKVFLLPVKTRINPCNNKLELIYEYEGLDWNLYCPTKVLLLDWKLEKELRELNSLNVHAMNTACTLEFYSNQYHFEKLVAKIAQVTGISIEYKRTSGFKATSNKASNYIHLPNYNWFATEDDCGGEDWWPWEDERTNIELTILAHELTHHVQYRKGIGHVNTHFNLGSHPKWDFYKKFYKEEKHELEQEAYALQYLCEQYENHQCLEIVKIIWQLVDLITS